MNKFFARIGLTVLLTLSLVGTMVGFAAAANTNASTSATIAFVEGELELVDGDLGDGIYDLNIDFGSNPLPVGATVYIAVDTAHTLRVQDGRVNAGDWEITVEMSKFINQTTSSNAFDAIITLTNGTASISSQTQTGDLTIATPLIIDSTSTGSVLVESASAGFSHGTFDTTWAMTSVALSIDADAAKVTQPDEAYAATMVWTLGSV